MNNLITDINLVPKDKKLIVFDLDGTLADSKTDIDSEMAELLTRLLEVKKVAVIGGGKYKLFKEQLLDRLSAPSELLKNLFVFPTTSALFYRYDGSQWQLVYANKLSDEQKKRIFEAFDKTFTELNYHHPEHIYGQLIEDRDTEVTFSALGQEAPLELKEQWKKDHSDTKLQIAETLQKYLPDMEVRVAGYTSIDVTHKGIDKEYGLHQIRERLEIPLGEILFVGDALFEGGNDYPALMTGVACVSVKDISETKKLIQQLIK